MTDRKYLSMATKYSSKHLGSPPATSHVPGAAQVWTPGKSQLGQACLRVLRNHVYRPDYCIPTAGLCRVASLPEKGSKLELEEMLVHRRMSTGPLKSCWLPATSSLDWILWRGQGVWNAPQMQCKNILKIQWWKMDPTKYHKLVKGIRSQQQKCWFTTASVSWLKSRIVPLSQKAWRLKKEAELSSVVGGNF